MVTDQERPAIAAGIISLMLLLKKKKKGRKRLISVKPWLARRETWGIYNNFKSSSAAVRTGLIWLDNTSTCLHVCFNSTAVLQLMRLELELKHTWRHVLVLSCQMSPVRTAADDDLN